MGSRLANDSAWDGTSFGPQAAASARTPARRPSQRAHARATHSEAQDRLGDRRHREEGCSKPTDRPDLHAAPATPAPHGQRSGGTLSARCTVPPVRLEPVLPRRPVAEPQLAGGVEGERGRA